MKCHKLLSLAVVTLGWLAMTSLSQAETVLCTKRLVTQKNGKVPLSRNIKSASGTCPRGFVQIYSAAGPAALLSSIEGVDGAGSGLDADLLDGKSSDEFASAAALSSLDAGTAAALASLAARTTAVESETRQQNVVRVAKAGGDHVSILEALAALSNPSTANPYLITVAPGVFTEPAALVIPAGVQLRGAGVDLTTVQVAVSAGAPGAGSAALTLSGGASAADLTVENTAISGVYLTGIAVSGASVAIPSDPSQVTTAIDNVRVRVNGAGGNSHMGIYISDSSVRIMRSAIEVNNASAFHTGIHFTISSGTHELYLEQSSVHAYYAATFSDGVRATSGGNNAIINLVQSRVYGVNYGLYSSGGVIRAAHSTIRSNGTALRAAGAGAAIIANSVQIDAAGNALASGGGTITCSFVSELTTGVGYANTCS